MTETIKQRIEREIREGFEAMRAQEEIDPMAKLAAAHETLKAGYHRKCDELIASRANEQKAREERDAALVKLEKIKTFAEKELIHSGGWDSYLKTNVMEIIGPDPITAPKSKSGISLHNKKDGIWLGIHASSTGRSALILLNPDRWGRLVRKTFEDYFAEQVPEGAAAKGSR